MGCQPHSELEWLNDRNTWWRLNLVAALLGGSVTQYWTNSFPVYVAVSVFFGSKRSFGGQSLLCTINHSHGDTPGSRASLEGNIHRYHVFSVTFEHCHYAVS